MKISNRSLTTSFSPIRKLEGLSNKIKKQGIEIYNLNIGQSDLPTPRLFVKSLKKNINHPIEYAPSAGYQQVISAWKNYFLVNNKKFNTDEIIVTVGASEALVLSFLVTMDIGDELLIFEPFYANYKTFSAIAGIKLKPITLDIGQKYKLPNKKNIEKHITKKTKAILLCNPVNPTGKAFNQKELSDIIAIAKKNKLFIISDETYNGMTFDNIKLVNLSELPKLSQQIIVIDSLSKRFNICGARIGCIASKNKKVMVGIIKYAQARLSVPTLEQLAVVPLLNNSKKITNPIVKEYQNRKNIVYKILSNIKDIEIFEPQGAFYMMIKLPIKNAEDFCHWLVNNYSINKQTLLLTPGKNFYMTKGKGLDEVRLAFVLNSYKLKIALNIFKKGLIKYKKIINN